MGFYKKMCPQSTPRLAFFWNKQPNVSQLARQHSIAISRLDRHIIVLIENPGLQQHSDPLNLAFLNSLPIMLQRYSRKNPTRGGRGYIFLKTLPQFFIFLLYPWKFQTKQSSILGYSTKLCQIPWKFQGQNQRPLEIQQLFFLGHPWKFHFVFIFDTPGNTISSNPPPPPPPCPCLDFFRNSPQGKVTEAGKFGAGNFSQLKLKPILFLSFTFKLYLRKDPYLTPEYGSLKIKHFRE